MSSKKINDNAYILDFTPEYEINPSFNICYLSPFVGVANFENDLDLRTNPFQEEGFDGGSSV